MSRRKDIALEGEVMKSLAIGILALVLLACKPAEPDPPAMNVVVAPAPEPLPEAESKISEPLCVEKAEYDSLGNKWWAGFDACEGDIRIEVQADSVNLRGPSLRFEVYTKRCPGGPALEAGYVDRAFFFEPFDRQLMLFKRQIARSLSRLKPPCASPTDRARVLGPKFDRAFRQLAESKWLGLSKAQMQQSWDSDR